MFILDHNIPTLWGAAGIFDNKIEPLLKRNLRKTACFIKFEVAVQNKPVTVTTLYDFQVK